MLKWVVLLCLSGCFQATVQAGAFRLGTDTDQLIVKFTTPVALKLRLQALDAGRVRALSALAGTPLTAHRASEYGQIVKLFHRVPLSDAQEIARRISSSPDVLYAEPDKRVLPLNVPNDPDFFGQWNLQGIPTNFGGINLPSAWDITTGRSSVVVAVLDSGILYHADLNGRLLPGYDFVSDVLNANDGDGRDSDPTDPGDWITAEEASSTFDGCPVSNSSWHGTHIAGILGANSNNGTGIAGVNWGSWVLPVRVMGKCGGYISDIADGMLWAVGLPVAGVPANPNPAKVLNLSLGGDGPCSITEQNAINSVINSGAVIVVAAGNETQDAANVSPGNCQNVVTVGATTILGARASYSNYGSRVDISAPGGDAGGGILSTGDSGKTTANHDNTYRQKIGTSMSAPHVSGVVSLMFSVNPLLTPSDVKNILKSTARPFPSGTAWDCTSFECGAGILDASAALNASFPGTIPIQVSGVPSGNPINLTLQATIQPRTADLNKTVNLYVGAKFNDQWYLRNNTAWVPWTGGPLPVFSSAVAINIMSLTVAQSMNVSGLIGTQVYVGYGVDDADLLDQHKYGLIYTVH